MGLCGKLAEGARWSIFAPLDSDLLAEWIKLSALRTTGAWSFNPSSINAG